MRALTPLGHDLGLRVTVEGVETQEPLAVLRELGCDQRQGYLFARPAPMTSLSETGRSDRERAWLRALFSDEAARACA
ncbi:hypothetical protein Y590_19970 [Methylobacterium sp. AMS5]|nr:hypothetical protein Y590_19970 [Methylobacterium sp. AMS5]